MQTHFLWGYVVLLTDRRKSESNCIGESKASFKVQIFLSTEFRQYRYTLSQITDTLLQFLGTRLCLAEFCDRLSEFFLGVSKGNFVCLRGHD